MSIKDLPQGDEIAQIRQSVRKLCETFPPEYWRKLDRENAYPSEFVKALSDAGYLSVLIPEEYGGSGLPLMAAAAILEEVQRTGANGAACHAQMYIMSALLRHGNPEQKAKYLPGVAAGELRLQAFGVTEPTSGRTPARSRHSPGARVTTITSMARRSGHHAPNIPTSCFFWRGPRQRSRPLSEPTACRSSSSTWARRSRAV